MVWTNFGSDHTVTADDNSFSSTTTGGAAMGLGETFTQTFPAVGRYPYYCQLHGGPGGQDMAGVVRVLIPGQNQLPSTPVNLTPAGGATSQSTSPVLSASAFADADSGDVHAASRWIIRDATQAVVFDSQEDSQSLTTISVSGLPAGTTFSWQVSYKDDRGGWSAYSSATQFFTVASQGQNGSGLLGTYAFYNLKRDLVTVRATQLDPIIDFDWGVRKPHKLSRADNFFIRWEGTVVSAFSETYRFRLSGDGGMRLWLNGEKIVDDWASARFPLYRSGTVVLQASVPATIKLEYFDSTGRASVRLRWSSLSQPLQVIPQARLFPPPQ